MFIRCSCLVYVVVCVFVVRFCVVVCCRYCRLSLLLFQIVSCFLFLFLSCAIVVCHCGLLLLLFVVVLRRFLIVVFDCCVCVCLLLVALVGHCLLFVECCMLFVVYCGCGVCS